MGNDFYKLVGGCPPQTILLTCPITGFGVCELDQNYKKFSAKIEIWNSFHLFHTSSLLRKNLNQNHSGTKHEYISLKFMLCVQVLNFTFFRTEGVANTFIKTKHFHFSQNTFRVWQNAFIKTKHFHFQNTFTFLKTLSGCGKTCISVEKAKEQKFNSGPGPLSWFFFTFCQYFIWFHVVESQRSCNSNKLMFWKFRRILEQAESRVWTLTRSIFDSFGIGIGSYVDFYLLGIGSNVDAGGRDWD